MFHRPLVFLLRLMSCMTFSLLDSTENGGEEDKLNQEPCLEYTCRICKKVFTSGRALGGHMRTHGVGVSDNGQQLELEEVNEKKRNHFYSLRTYPSRIMSFRSCSICGKGFMPEKTSLVQDKCNDCVENEAILMCMNEDGDEAMNTTIGWSKGKRSKRFHVSEEEDLANYLVKLSEGSSNGERSITNIEETFASTTETVTVPAGKEIEEEQWNLRIVNGEKEKNMFECKACKRVFDSHQALGGHRASHKRVKGCFAAKLGKDLKIKKVEEDSTKKVNENLDQKTVPCKKKLKLHECSVCHRSFNSGQALGGHKRCHWIVQNSPGMIFPTYKEVHYPEQLQKHDKSNEIRGFDLNELPSEISEPLPEISHSTWIGFQSNDMKSPMNTSIRNDIHGNIRNVTTDGNDGRKNGYTVHDIQLKLNSLSNIQATKKESSGHPSWLQVGNLRTSQEVIHPATTLVQAHLTAENFRWDPVIT